MLQKKDAVNEPKMNESKMSESKMSESKISKSKMNKTKMNKIKIKETKMNVTKMNKTSKQINVSRWDRSVHVPTFQPEGQEYFVHSLVYLICASYEA